MKVWWLTDFERVDVERAAINALEGEAADWLRDARWKIDGIDLCLDADVAIGTAIYCLRLRYPSFFPSIPIIVTPRDKEAHWSFHQYGQGGELCLEWRPDNWQREVTGAQMLRSAHRLLSAENPLGEGERTSVPSSHEASFGQRMRGKSYRLVLTAPAAEYLNALSEGTQGEAELSLAFRRASRVAVLEAVEVNGTRWSDAEVSVALWRSRLPLKLMVVSISGLIADVRACASLEELTERAVFNGHDLAGLEVIGDGGRCRFDGLLLCDAAGEIAALRIDQASRRIDWLETIIAKACDAEDRLGPAAAQLREKCIGIVGMGSLGSKVAAMLRRSGVRKFLLIDDEVMLPENLVRHALDWESVGDHKVDGVALHLELLGPDVDVRVRRQRLTGQESTVSTAAALEELAACDVIFDATACPQTFGLLAGVVRQAKTCLVWAEIFAGGLGGLVARSRPGLDPDPFEIRNRVLAYCEHQLAPPSEAGAAYGAGGNDSPWIAADADVTVIAAHAARLALDLMLKREPSDFPYSVYLVGLSRGWIFEEPFHTIPLDVGTIEERRDGENRRQSSEETIAFLSKILEQRVNG